MNGSDKRPQRQVGAKYQFPSAVALDGSVLEGRKTYITRVGGCVRGWVI